MPAALGTTEALTTNLDRTLDDTIDRMVQVWLAFRQLLDAGTWEVFLYHPH